MAGKKDRLHQLLTEGERQYMPGISIDNVIFGFHEQQLRVLLVQAASGKHWMLPGGFIGKEEDIDAAAIRILRVRTGLDDVFLQQFHTFGQTDRKRNPILVEALSSLNLPYPDDFWALGRFISIGYYALVEFDRVRPRSDEFEGVCEWHEPGKLPAMIMDHGRIIQRALEEMRLRLNYQPVGYNLLPETFTMKELQKLYETILDKKLDRANFNRKMLGYGILDRKRKRYTGGAHRAPYLYSFNKKKYFKALEQGL